MQGLYGLIINELKRQRKLPDKWAYPDGPKIATSGCVLYADAINNNGGSHSNSATRWTPIIGSVKGIKAGSPVWTNTGLNTTNGGFYFQKTSGNKQLTMEAVFTPLQEATTYTRILNNVQGGGHALSLIKGDSGKSMIRGAIQKQGPTVASWIDTGTVSIDTANKTWYVCCTYDGKRLRGYVHGYGWFFDVVSSAGSLDTPAPWAVGYNPNADGAHSSTGEDFIGLIHSVRLYNRAISEDEMFENLAYERNRYNF